MAQQQKTIRIDSLPTDQLDHLGKQLDRELNRLQQSANMLATLANEYSVSESAVQELKTLSDGAHRSLVVSNGFAVHSSAKSGELCVQLMRRACSGASIVVNAHRSCTLRLRRVGIVEVTDSQQAGCTLAQTVTCN